MKLIQLIFAVFILLNSYSSFGQIDNFEGIIIYQRTTSKGKVAFETYYFGNKKLRIDSDYLFDQGIKKMVSIFDFDKYTNIYFSESDGKFIEKEIKSDNIKSFKIDSTHTKNILGYTCQPIDITLKQGLYSTNQTQVKYLADSLIFEIPKGWLLDWEMVSHIDNRIALVLDETIKSDEAGIQVIRGYRRKAISIVQMKLPDAIFQM